MPIEIRMPALSPTMEKGTLAKWLVKEGDEVSSGDVIAEIETDKATMEVESIDDGRVGRLVVAEGAADVPVGELIAVLLEEGEEAGATPGPAPKKADKPAAKPEKAEQPAPSPSLPRKQEPIATEPDPLVREDDRNGAEEERVLASPLAKRIAKQSGLDLSAIQGSGPGGRVVKRDLDDAEPQAKATPAARPAGPSVAAVGDAPFEEKRLSAMRRVIARRMIEAKTTVPHFYLSVEVRMDRLLKLRAKLNEQEDVKLSVNDFLIKALALALIKTPAANVQYAEDRLRVYGRADVAVAVAIEGGLITPIIKDAASKGLGVISSEMRDLAGRARDGKLAPEEYQGGTVSLSNLGMYGIREFEAIINPPQAAILAVGVAEERAIVKDGNIKSATMMTATLSCDHRAIDGAIGAELLTAFKKLVEKPLKMLL